MITSCVSVHAHLWYHVKKNPLECMENSVMCVLSKASWPHSTIYSNEISYSYCPECKVSRRENRSRTKGKLWWKIPRSVVLW